MNHSNSRNEPVQLKNIRLGTQDLRYQAALNHSTGQLFGTGCPSNTWRIKETRKGGPSFIKTKQDETAYLILARQ